MLTLIKDGRIIDPGNIDGTGDILVEDRKIKKVTLHKGGAPSADSPDLKPDKTIDAAGKIVVPGLIDMHVHLREPGHEYKETIESGCRAASYGGFTTICCMPNTNPVNDSREVTEYILSRAAKANRVRVLPVGAISKGLDGKQLSEFNELKSAGAVAVTDDGLPVTNSLLMRRALEYAKGFGLPVISHCEDKDLVSNGVMNEGETATRMGLAGIPNAAESIMVARDIFLCELTGVPVHIAHVSTKESVNIIRDAKKRGAPVTAETAPHYFSLTDKAVKGYETNAKMNPPLRSEQDQKAIWEGLADGTIDVIATDHAPHSDMEKEVEFDRAANGIIGLETSLSLGLKLVENNVLSLSRLIEKMSKNPARILGIENALEIGNPADITIMDLERFYTVDAGNFQSKSRNTPFDGWQMKGKAALTMVDGRIVFDDM
jgi:dihydroorotase